MLIEQIIKNEIKKHKFITIADFMRLALYHPEHGYYIKRNPIGANADFTTAPEISQLFGEVVAVYLLNFIIQNLEQSPKINLVEIGAGQGTLMADILRIISKFPEIAKKIEVTIIEVNEVLTEVQKQKLQKYNFKVSWCKNIKDITKNNAPVVIVANEFFDCLPIEQFIFKNNQWLQVVIKLDENKNFVKSEIENNALVEKVIPKNLSNIFEGAIYEFSSEVIAEFQSICDVIRANKGMFLTFDYAYFASNYKDSLQSIKAHKYNDIFANIGQADLTAYVDFDMLKNIALKNNFQNIYCSTQGNFLRENNIELRAQKLSENKNLEMKNQIYSGLNRLIHSSEMGDIFKTFAISYI
jgi:NADH dehydrogenase [ubiquinone] 1 alpha subcomplex assembly factor 7